MSTYAENLNAIKQQYPFDKWKATIDDGLDMWSAEECDEMISIFDKLIAKLVILGIDGTEKKKIKLFRKAVDATNDWGGSIDTLAREDLIHLLYEIAGVAGVAHDDTLDEDRDW